MGRKHVAARVWDSGISLWAGFRGGGYWALSGTLAVLVGLLCILWEPPLRNLLARIERGRRWARFGPKLASAIASLRVVASLRAIGLPVLLSLIGWGSKGWPCTYCSLALATHLRSPSACFSTPLPPWRARWSPCPEGGAVSCIPVFDRADQTLRSRRLTTAEAHGAWSRMSPFRPP
jgi:hypothetical protein